MKISFFSFFHSNSQLHLFRTPILAIMKWRNDWPRRNHEIWSGSYRSVERRRGTFQAGGSTWSDWTSTLMSTFSASAANCVQWETRTARSCSGTSIDSMWHSRIRFARITSPRSSTGRCRTTSCRSSSNDLFIDTFSMIPGFLQSFF